MMIRAEELRKGNLFLCQLEINKPAEACIVEWLTEDGITNQYGGICPYEASNPITLTPEILDQLGFVFNRNEGYYYLPLPNKPLGINVLKVGSGVFVHQLQNLYFALTGEELNVKL